MIQMDNGDDTSEKIQDENIEKKSVNCEALLELQSPNFFSLHPARVWFDFHSDFLRDRNDGVSGTLGGLRLLEVHAAQTRGTNTISQF